LVVGLRVVQFRGNRVRNFKSLSPIAITNSSVNPRPPPKALVKQLPTYTWCLLSEEGGSPSHCHVTALLRELHRLQVRYRIQFKIYSSRLRPSTGNSQFTSKNLFHLRSQPCIAWDHHLMVLYLSGHLFELEPKLCNALPHEIRSTFEINTFKRHLWT